MKIKKINIIGYILAVILIPVFIYPISAHAVIIGNKNWLQIADTGGYSYNDINGVFSQTTGLCDASSCQLGGIDLTEYTWASNDDVNNLLASVTGLSFSSFTDDGGLVGTTLNTTDPIFTLFTPTFTGIPPFGVITEAQYVGGYTRTGNGSDGTTIEIINYFDPTIADRVAFEMHFDPTRNLAEIGGWFYTAAVPIPPAIYLFFSGFLSLLYVARKNKRS